jgi:hypothetical protein
MINWIDVKNCPPPPMQDVLLAYAGGTVIGWNESTQPEEDPSYCTFVADASNG